MMMSQLSFVPNTAEDAVLWVDISNFFLAGGNQECHADCILWPIRPRFRNYSVFAGSAMLIQSSNSQLGKDDIRLVQVVFQKTVQNRH